MIRVFTKPLELENTTIENWRLFKELNIILYEYLKNSFGRDLTTEEVQEACFAILVDNHRGPSLPTWKAFFDILRRRVDSESNLFYQKIHHDLNNIKGLKKLLDNVNIEELEEIHQLSEEEQFSRVLAKLGDNMKTIDVKKIVKVLFEELDEVPIFKYYYAVNANLPISEEMEKRLRSSLAKQSLREEIEKRLLNTCIDACPSCLQTRCEIDFDLRSRLLLSRRLLNYVFSKLKEKYTINVDDFSDKESLKQEVIKKLEKNYQAYLVYSFDKSAEVAKLVSELLTIAVHKGGKRYRITINSSGYRRVSLRTHKVVYEVCLRCVEVSL